MGPDPSWVIIGTAKASEVPGKFLCNVGRPLLLGSAHAFGASGNDVIEQLADVVVGLLRALWGAWQANRALAQVVFRFACLLHT